MSQRPQTCPEPEPVPPSSRRVLISSSQRTCLSVCPALHYHRIQYKLFMYIVHILNLKAEYEIVYIIRRRVRLRGVSIYFWKFKSSVRFAALVRTIWRKSHLFRLKRAAQYRKPTRTPSLGPSFNDTSPIKSIAHAPASMCPKSTHKSAPDGVKFIVKKNKPYVQCVRMWSVRPASHCAHFRSKKATAQRPFRLGYSRFSRVPFLKNKAR